MSTAVSLLTIPIFFLFWLPAHPADQFYASTMNLKAIFQKVFPWIKSEAKTVEQKAANLVSSVEVDVSAELARLTTLIPETPIQGLVMSTPAVAPAAPATTNTNVDSAIKIALFLKALDANLTDAAVQDATNAALAAAYPAA